jgi:hypothetical protein
VTEGSAIAGALTRRPEKMAAAPTVNAALIRKALAIREVNIVISL